MNDQTTMTMTLADGTTTGPFTESDLKRAADGVDALLLQAAEMVIQDRKCSTSYIQRKLAIGYNKAARLVEAMEEAGIVSPPNSVGKRDVLVAELPKHLQIAKTAMTSVKRALGERSRPIKETAADQDVKDKTHRVAAEELRSFIERFERLEAEKKDIADAQKEVMAEAKGRGYDTKVMRKIIALRKREPDDIAEEEAVLDMYKSALGM
ncbi:DUF2312 domain-containing protein [Vannielia litorea]|nr:DUF2312 domain-containing protein [Vannielia litorea]